MYETSRWCDLFDTRPPCPQNYELDKQFISTMIVTFFI